MSILTRPRPPRFDLPPDPEAPEALIEEARRRARRRRRGYAACTLVAAACGLLAFYGFNGGGTVRPHDDPPLAGAAAAAQEDAARWRLAPGFESGDIRELVVSPQHLSTLFAVAGPVTGGGVFKSVDGGRTWRFLSIGYMGRIDALAIAPQDPKTLYVGTGAGVFKSTDGGASWQAASSGLPAAATAYERQHRAVEGYVDMLVVDPRDPETVYAGTYSARDATGFKTTNGGASWRGVGPPVSNLAIAPTDPATLYATRDSGVFKSSDAGASWRRTGLRRRDVDALVVDPKHPKTIYAVTDRSGIFKSSDGGASWRAAGLAGKSLGRLLLDPLDPETLYAQAGARIFKSRDGGRTWQALAVDQGAELLALHPRKSAKLYAGSVGRILTSLDAGRSWRATGRGPGAAEVSALAVDARTGTAYAAIWGGGIATKAGGRWRTVNTDRNVTALAVDPQDPDVVYAGAEDPARLLKSTDGGRSWRRLRVPSKPWIPDPNQALVSALAVDPQNPKAVHASIAMFGSPPVWFKSTDGGDTWEVPEDTVGEPDSLAFDPLDPDTGYAYGEGSSLLKSTNGGAIWQRTGSVSVQNLTIDPREPATLYAVGDGGVIKSTDAGSSWRVVNAGLKYRNISSLAIDPHGQTVYAGTESGVFRSTAGGRSWSRFSRGLPPDGVGALAVDPAGGILYAVLTKGGIYELRLPR